jgi:hypothetical protein
MHTKTEHYMLSREEIYAMLTKEDLYAQAWDKGKSPSEAAAAFPKHAVSRTTGEPFSEMDWLNFAEKYLAEFKLAHANYCPDHRALRIRLLKAASMLVTALQVSGEHSDLETIAGVSCTQFPILHGGLQTFKTTTENLAGSAKL